METFQLSLLVNPCIGCSVLPLNLRFAATSQSVVEVGADLQTLQLAVNLGACLFNGSSDSHAQFRRHRNRGPRSVSLQRPADNQIRVVVPVGLPD